ncbi:MAG: hypothetical protein KDM63_15430, partial [Verrucomicrobiae bacterium]|nr:hypothetical protein [Verrucomicrobiae bacterium]
YRENYDDIEVASPIRVKDDRPGNRIVVKESYRLPNPWTADPEDPEWFSMNVFLQGIRDVLVQADHTHREAPLALEHPLSRRHEIRLHLPGTNDDWEGFFDESKQRHLSAAGEFESWTKYNGRKVEATIVANYHTTADHVDPEDLKDYVSATSKSYEATAIELWETNQPSDDSSASMLSSSPNANGNEEVAWAFLIGIGSLVVGAVGFGVGCLITFLVMRERRTNPAAGGPSPTQFPPQHRSGPPPLPPDAR